MSRTWLLLALALLVGALAVLRPGCGGDDGPREGAGPAAPAGTQAPVAPTLQGQGARPQAPTPDPGASAVVLTGRVVRAGSRRPVTAARVALIRGERTVVEVTSAADGRFRLLVPQAAKGEPAGSAPVLTARAEGTTTLRAVPPSSKGLVSGDVGDLVLRAGWTLHGMVRGEEGEPVPGARIHLLGLEPEPDTPSLAGTWAEVGHKRVCESGADGTFRLEGVAPRPFRLVTVARGYVTSWQRGQVHADGALLEVRLRRGQRVRVRVVDASGKPVAGARVNLYPAFRTTFAGHYKINLDLDRSAATDPAGQCLLTGLSERNYRVTAHATGLGSADAALLAGWTEVVLHLRPDWRSGRYAYEQGPPGAAGSPFPRERFLWVHAGPRPSLPAPSPSEDGAADAPVPGDADEEADEEEDEEGRVPADAAWVRARVRCADGSPVPDVYLRFDGPKSDSGITEEDGTELLFLAPGRYTYWVSPVGFGTDAGDLRGHVELAGGIVTRVEFALPRVHRVRVEVRDTGGELLPRTRVVIRRGDEDKQAWTNEQGALMLFAETGEPFSLLALPDDSPCAFLASVPVPSDGPVVLRVPERGEVRGRVVDPGGSPLFGAWVGARREGIQELGEETWQAWTDDRGLFVLEGPAIGTYRVSARHGAFGEAEARVEVTDTPLLVDLQLHPLARFRGRLLDREGAGIPGTRIEVVGEPGGLVGSGADGRFEMVLPRAGERSRLRASCEGFIPLLFEVVRNERTTDLALSRGIALTLTVRCPEGRAFEVRFEDPGTGARRTSGSGDRTEGDDEVIWRWSHAPDGAVRVRLVPTKGPERVLDYQAREGEVVALEATLP